LWVWPGITAAELQWHIVDGVRKRVTEESRQTAAERFVRGELEAEIFPEAIRHIVVDITLLRGYAVEGTPALGRGGPGDRLVRVPLVLQVTGQVADSSELHTIS
jgi:hypothetical protein